jgi:hypothetical protein
MPGIPLSPPAYYAFNFRSRSGDRILVSLNFNADWVSKVSRDRYRYIGVDKIASMKVHASKPKISDLVVIEQCFNVASLDLMVILKPKRNDWILIRKSAYHPAQLTDRALVKCIGAITVKLD